MRLSSSRIVQSPILLIALFLVVLTLISTSLWTYSVNRSENSLDALSLCFVPSTDTTLTAQCLRNTVQNLLTQYSARDLMDYATATTSPSAVRIQCHPIGHVVGELIYKKYGSLEGALTQCNSNCRSACVHGAIGAGVLSEMGQGYPEEDIAHADKAELENLSLLYCKRSTPVCHGIGHVAYITMQNDTDALSICDAASVGKPRQSCYEGVFMELAGTFINALFPSGTEKLPEVREGDYTYPCTGLEKQYRHACFLFLNAYQSPLFEKDGFSTPEAKLEKATRVCDSLRNPDRASCFEGIGISSSMFGFINLRPKDMDALCDRFTTQSDRNACTLGVVPQFLYTQFNGLYEYCRNIGETPRKSLCYDAAFEWAEALLKIIDNPKSMCGANKECLAHYDVFSQRRAIIPDYRFGLFGM